MPTAGDAQGAAAERQDPPCTEAPAQVQPSAGKAAQMPDVPPTEEGSTACVEEGGGMVPPLAQEAVHAAPETAQHAAGTAERVPPEMVQEAAAAEECTAAEMTQTSAETAEHVAAEQPQEPQPSSAGALPAAGQGGQAEGQVLPSDAVQAAEPCVPPPERAAEASPATEQDTGTADEESPTLSNEELLAHTAALWQYRPVPAGEPDPAPEYMAAAMRIGTADMVAARVRGKKHKHDGTNCDDWFAAVHVGDIAILAVSDGAGSKRLSRVGARAASEAAVGAVYTQLRALLTGNPELRAAYALPMEEAAFGEACAHLVGILHEGVRAARAAVEAAFYARCGRTAYTDLLGREPVLGDLAATLLLTLAVPVPEHGELLVLSCQVGDGMTAAVNTRAPYGSAVKLLGRPDSGDFVGETEFLTSDGMTDIAALQRRTLVSRGVCDLLLTMTDGVADDYFSETELHRLCLDLALNGILPSAAEDAMFTRAEVDLLRSLPHPEAFPWVNDKEELIALHDARRCCRMAQCTVEELWQNAHVLPLAAADTSMAGITEHAQRLEIWLDNYMERGSFDDRTLALLRMGTRHV